MKIIIIGSKGFIGHHLLNHYREVGYEVWGADVINDYTEKNYYFLIDASNADYRSVFERLEYDLCINCSGAASVPDSMENPMRDFHLNTLNVYKLLEAIRIFQPACRLINLSSAAVYGNPVKLPVAETDLPNPLSPYGTHKLLAEQICKEYYDFFKIRSCNLRLFSVYGPGLRKQLFWDLYNKAVANTPFTLYGTGFESRDFINVADLVKAIDIVGRCSAFEADIVNVANGEEILIKDAVSIFLGFFRHKTSYFFSGETREGDPKNWLADISRLRSCGYQQSIEIYDGLKTYYEWVKSGSNK